MRCTLFTYAALASLASGSAGADTITFEFVGTVSGNTHFRAPWSAVPVDAAAKVIFTFDPATADSNPSGFQGDYNGAISALTVTLGTVSESVSSGDVQMNNSIGLGMDLYRPGTALAAGFDFSVQLSSDFMACGPLVTDGLATVIDLSQWSNKHGELCDYQVGRCVSIEWTSFRVVLCEGDADHNNTVNFADVTNVLANFLSDCQ